MMKTVQSFVVSNKAFTNQMLGQQLIMWLGQEIGQTLNGYYKYRKLTLYSTDSHLNHQIFIRKYELLEKLMTRAQMTFGATITIKDILFIARTQEIEYGGYSQKLV